MVHTYTATGVYSPSLTVTRPSGTSNTNRLNYIIVTDPAANVTTLGDNSFGQCDVALRATNSIAIAAGAWHSLALRADGQVVAWADDWDGQGDVPPTLSGALAIAAGGYHSLAVRADGTVVAWGDNSQGQCSVPTGLTNIVAVAGGGAHSVALAGDGTLVAWGANWNGQSSLPTTGTNAVSVAAGSYHTLVLLDDGTFVPRVINPSRQDSQASMLVQTYQSRNYVLEGRNALATETWTAVSTNHGNGALKVLTDPCLGASQRFYRVRQQ